MSPNANNRSSARMWLPPRSVGWLALLLCAGLLLPATPLLRPVPTRDAGVFLYIGQQMLAGGVPYRDVWDHKLPLIYLIDALGLLIGGGSLWGIWLLELLSLYVALMLGYTTLRRLLDCGPALASTAVWLTAFAALLAGESAITEEFALPFQFAALALFSHPAWQVSRWRWAAIGACGGACALLKPTLAGVHLAIGCVLLLDILRRRQPPAALLWLIVGALTPLAPVGLYLGLTGAWPAFLDQAIRYNAVYAQSPLGEQIDAIMTGLSIMPVTAALAIAGWLVALGRLRPTNDTALTAGAPAAAEQRAQGMYRTPHATTLLLVAAIGLPLELVLAGLPGRPYAHYFMAWMPLFGLLAGLCAQALADLLSRAGAGRYRPLALITLGALASALPALIIAVRLADAPRESPTEAAVAYVRQHTGANDHVLVWGAEASINAASGRAAPSRYVYQYPLYTRGYTQAALVEVFAHELAARPPALIIDSSPDNPLIPPLDAAQRHGWAPASDAYVPPPELSQVYRFIAAHYQLVAHTSSGRWPIYARRTAIEP